MVRKEDAVREVERRALIFAERHIDALFYDLFELQDESGLSDTEMFDVVESSTGQDISGWWVEWVHDERTRRMR